MPGVDVSPLIPEQRTGPDDWSNPEIVRALAGLTEEVRRGMQDLRTDIAGMRKEFVPRETIAAWREENLAKRAEIERDLARTIEHTQRLELQIEADKADRLELEHKALVDRSRFITAQAVTLILGVAALVVAIATK